MQTYQHCLQRKSTMPQPHASYRLTHRITGRPRKNTETPPKHKTIPIYRTFRTIRCYFFFGLWPLCPKWQCALCMAQKIKLNDNVSLPELHSNIWAICDQSCAVFIFCRLSICVRYDSSSWSCLMSVVDLGIFQHHAKDKTDGIHGTIQTWCDQTWRWSWQKEGSTATWHQRVDDEKVEGAESPIVNSK